MRWSKVHWIDQARTDQSRIGQLQHFDFLEWLTPVIGFAHVAAADTVVVVDFVGSVGFVGFVDFVESVVDVASAVVVVVAEFVVGRY